MNNFDTKFNFHIKFKTETINVYLFHPLSEKNENRKKS